MATIRKLQSGKFQAIIRRKGHPDRVQTFTTRRAAETWASVAEGDIASGRAHGAAHAHRFSDLCKAYRSGPLTKLRAASDRERFIVLWESLLPDDPRLADITPDVIASALNTYAARPVARRVRRAGKVVTVERERSTQTVRHAHTCLSSLLDFAHRRLHWVSHNAARDHERAPPAPPRITWLKTHERERLLEACRESANPDLYLVVLLALSSGARQGEIVNLRWSQIDWKRRVAWLTPEGTKTAEPRAMPLVEEVIAELKRRPRVLHVDHVFGSPTKRNQPRNMRQAWVVARTRAGLPDFRFHDLRHSAATELLRAGVDSRVVAAVLGHKTLAMMKRYAHVEPTLVVDAADRAARAAKRTV